MSRRFPWYALLAMWGVVSAGLLAAFWHRVVAIDLADADDYMRLLQVRDLLAGQSWFDLTQYRIAPPTGLAMHWSRLVDLPLLVFLVPLRPLLGQAPAESVALAGAPLLTLLALMVVVTLLVRALVSKQAPAALLACLFAISAPLVLVQIHPARIDHHGWQIVLGGTAFAALLWRDARASGVVAGIAAALYLTISIEGAPFVAALGGAVAIAWIMRADTAERLVGFAVALAGGSVAATALLAPVARWSDGACDAIGPAHLAALVLLVPSVAVATRWSDRRSAAWRTLALALAALPALAALATIAPQCLSDPYGTMLPVVRHYWFENVFEGMPFWRQSPIDALTQVVFPAIGLAGTLSGGRGAGSPEMRRRWLVAAIVSVATLSTGALVLRAAGLAHVVAIPGAMLLLGRAVAFAQRIRMMPARVVLSASAVLGLSPLMPVVAAAALPAGAPIATAPTSTCDTGCAYANLAKLPPATIFAGVDLGADIVARTPHSAYGAGYHRLQRPIADTITVFTGDEAAAHRFLRDRDIRMLLFDAASNETAMYARVAPAGVAAQLGRGQVPAWLRHVDLGSPTLQLYLRRD